MDFGGRTGYDSPMENTTTTAPFVGAPDRNPAAESAARRQADPTLEVTPGLIEWDGPTRPLAVAEVHDAPCPHCGLDLDEVLDDFRDCQEFQPTHVRGEFSWSCPVVCSCGQEVELTCASLGGE